MTVFTDGLRLEPENRGVSDYTGSYGESLGSTVGETVADWPTSQLLGIGELEHARGNDLSGMSGVDDALTFGGASAPAPAVAMIGKLEAADRVKAAGLDKELKLPDQDTIAAPALDIMINRARDRRERQATLERGPQGILPSALMVGTSFLVGAIDPLNIASAFIPVMGELRYGKLLADAGTSFAGRTAVRMGVGGASGAVGQAALEPLDWYAHTQEGRDFGMADVLHNLVFGAALGGGLHAAGGGIRDVYRSRKSLAQYPFGPGEPLDRAAAVASDALPDNLRAEPPAEFSPPTDVPPALAVLRDLPPRAQEDSMRAAIAALVDGEPVKVGEMLQAAAQSDRRIAESFEPERIRAATIEHDGRVYEGANHAEALAKLESERGVRLDDISDEALSAAFATTKGRTVSRDEALNIAQREGQHAPENVARLPNDAPNNVKGLIAEETTMAAPVLGDLDPAKAITAPKPRGRAAAHPDTLSLNEHLASQGGLRPDPKLSAIYGGDRGPFIPGFGPLIRKSGMPLDEALRSAKEHGYMSDPHDAENGTAGAGGRTSHGLTPNDLLDHLDAENRGQKLYKAGHLAATRYDPEQEKHVVFGHVEAELEAAGHTLSDIDGKLLDRTVEIVHREGERDVLSAYERAIMEDAERYEAISNARDAVANHPGRDIPYDAGAAPGGSRADPVDRGQAGRAGPGERGTDGAQSPRDGVGDQRTAERAWRDLAAPDPDVRDSAQLEASRAADKLPDPVETNLDRRVAAADKADAYAKQMYDIFEDRLPEQERVRLEDLIKKLDDDAAVRKEAIERSGACLFGARS